MSSIRCRKKIMKHQKCLSKKSMFMGSGCGTVDSTVAFATDDPGSNPAIGSFYWTCLLLTAGRKDENKEKNRSRKTHFLKKNN